MNYLFMLILGLIIYISFNNTILNPYFFDGADKVKHLLAFFTLSFLFFNSFKSIKYNYKLLSLLSFSIIIEIAQSFIGREASFKDIIASIAGIILYLFAYKFIKKMSVNI